MLGIVFNNRVLPQTPRLKRLLKIIQRTEIVLAQIPP